MKGYRTIIFTLIMGGASMVGLQIAPDTAQHWVSVIIGLWMAGAILLRFVTNTPFGKSLPPEVAQIANLIAATAPVGDAPVPAAGGQQASDPPASGGATITGPPTDLVGLATAITQALTTVQAVHDQVTGALQSAHQQVSAALPAPVAALIDPVPQPQPDPAPQPAPAA